DRLRLYTAPSSMWGIDGGFVTGVFLQTLGNEQVRPELATEFEGGFDADLLEDRLHVSVTGYRKTTDDMLLPVPVASSVYGNNVSDIQNIGVTRNTGPKMTMDATPGRSSALTWRAGTSLSQSRLIVEKLGPGVEPFYLSPANPPS